MKPFFYLFLFASMIGLFGLFIGATVGSFAFMPASSFFIPGHSLMGYLLSFSGLMTIGIPLVSLFYFLTRSFRKSTLKPSIRRGARILWISAFCVTVYGIIDTVTDFRANNKDFSFSSYEVTSDTINFNTVDPLGYYNGWYHIGAMRFTGDALYNQNYFVVVKKSENAELRIERSVTSNGSSPNNALENAQDLDHKITFDGSEVRIPSRAYLEKGEKFRGQYVEYTVFVPEGKQLIFDRRSQHRFMIDFEKGLKKPRNFYKYPWKMGKAGVTSKSWAEISNFKKNLKLDAPKTINIKSDFEIDMIAGNENELVIVGNKNEVENITIVQQDDILTIDNEYGNLDYPIKIYIKTPTLLNFNTSTDRKIRMEGFKQSEMDILMTGEGSLNAYLDVENLNLHSEKSTNISLTGQGKSLTIDLGYYSDFNAENFPVEILEVKNRMRGAKVKVANLIYTKEQLLNSFKVFGDPKILVGEVKEVEKVQEVQKVQEVEKAQEIKKVEKVQEVGQDSN